MPNPGKPSIAQISEVEKPVPNVKPQERSDAPATDEKPSVAPSTHLSTDSPVPDSSPPTPTRPAAEEPTLLPRSAIKPQTIKVDPPTDQPVGDEKPPAPPPPTPAAEEPPKAEAMVVTTEHGEPVEAIVDEPSKGDIAAIESILEHDPEAGSEHELSKVELPNENAIQPEIYEKPEPNQDLSPLPQAESLATQEESVSELLTDTISQAPEPQPESSQEVPEQEAGLAPALLIISRVQEEESFAEDETNEEGTRSAPIDASGNSEPVIEADEKPQLDVPAINGPSVEQPPTEGSPVDQLLMDEPSVEQYPIKENIVEQATAYEGKAEEAENKVEDAARLAKTIARKRDLFRANAVPKFPIKVIAGPDIAAVAVHLLKQKAKGIDIKAQLDAILSDE